MPVILRRIAFGFFWFGIFWLALLVIGGGIAGSMAGTPPPPGVTVQTGQKHAPEASVSASIDFREQYGHWVTISAAVLAAACTLGGVLPGTRKN